MENGDWSICENSLTYARTQRTTSAEFYVTLRYRLWPLRSIAVNSTTVRYSLCLHLHDECDKMDETSFERSVYTEFFEVVDKNGKNIKVLCKLCPPAAKKTFSTAINSTANLKKHLKVLLYDNYISRAHARSISIF